MSNQNIWVFFELSGGRPKRVCLEMMQKAKALAEGSSEKAVAVIIDPEPEEAVKAAFENGADQVMTVRQKFFFESAAFILEKLAEKYEPKIVMIGATTEGRDLAASASVRLHAGIASECTDVVATGSGVYWIRPSYDGRLNTNICIEEYPMIGTFKPGIFKLGEPETGRSGEVIEEAVEIPAGVLLTQLLGFTPDDELTKANIEDAEIIVAGGRGVGSKEGFGQLYELAAALAERRGAQRHDHPHLPGHGADICSNAAAPGSEGTDAGLSFTATAPVVFAPLLRLRYRGRPFDAVRAENW